MRDAGAEWRIGPSFGSAGKVTGVLIGGAVAMALQSDGEIVSLGEHAMARHNTNGSVDSSFGTNGQTTIVFNGGTSDGAQGLAIQPDGKIVVVGQTKVGTNLDFAVSRYLSSGTLDTSFGTGGKTSVDFSGGPDSARAVLIQPNGSIVVAGHAGDAFDNDFAVARFTPGGTLDTGFGTGGKVNTDAADGAVLTFAAALQADAKIVLAGRVDDDFCLVRYKDDGSLDTGFGSNGIVKVNMSRVPMSVTNFTDQATELAIQSDGKILVAGTVASAAPFGNSPAFALARFDANGSPDTGFGDNGLVTTTFSTLGADFGRGMALQGDGKIVVVGQTILEATVDFGVVRYTANGTPDTSFGTGGKLTVDFFGAVDDALDVAIQADGKLVVSGAATNGFSRGLGIIRINP